MVTLVPGDGVGPEVMGSVQEVFKAAGVPVDFEEYFVRYHWFVTCRLFLLILITCLMVDQMILVIFRLQ